MAHEENLRCGQCRFSSIPLPLCPFSCWFADRLPFQNLWLKKKERRHFVGGKGKSRNFWKRGMVGGRRTALQAIFLWRKTKTEEVEGIMMTTFSRSFQHSVFFSFSISFSSVSSYFVSLLTVSLCHSLFFSFLVSSLFVSLLLFILSLSLSLSVSYFISFLPFLFLSTYHFLSFSPPISIRVHIQVPWAPIVFSAHYNTGAPRSIPSHPWRGR